MMELQGRKVKRCVSWMGKYGVKIQAGSFWVSIQSLLYVSLVNFF